MKSVKDYVLEAEAIVKTYDIAQSVQLLDDEGVIFVDLRDAKEVDACGKIPGAQLASRGMLEFYIDPASPFHKAFFALDKQFVFYCGGGGRSVLAVQRAMEMGLKNVGQVGGGFKAWVKAGEPIETLTDSK